MLLPDIDSFQAAVHHDKLEYTLLVSMFYMHMYWLMFIRVEIEYKSEVFVYFWHIVVIVSRCKDTNKYSSGKINVVMRRKKKIFSAKYAENNSFAGYTKQNSPLQSAAAVG